MVFASIESCAARGSLALLAASMVALCISTSARSASGALVPAGDCMVRCCVTLGAWLRS